MAVYGRELRPRLWHWQARHPEWEDEPDAGWDPLVESYAYVSAANELVLVDPLVPDDDAQAFWAALDHEIARHARPQVFLTVFWHERSAPEIAKRYGGTVWADERRSDRLSVDAPMRYRPGDRLPGGLVAYDAVGRNESLLWLEEQQALFAGDIIHGDGDGVRLCPDDWLHEEMSAEEVRLALRALLELPVELVLTTHGPPVLTNGDAALARALEGPGGRTGVSGP